MVATIARKLAEEARQRNPDLANKPPAKALLWALADAPRIVVGGEAFTIEERLREIGGKYLPITREWLFEDIDLATKQALCELIAYKPLITVDMKQ